MNSWISISDGTWTRDSLLTNVQRSPRQVSAYSLTLSTRTHFEFWHSTPYLTSHCCAILTVIFVIFLSSFCSEAFNYANTLACVMWCNVLPQENSKYLTASSLLTWAIRLSTKYFFLTGLSCLLLPVDCLTLSNALQLQNSNDLLIFYAFCFTNDQLQPPALHLPTDSIG
jgi:hypothetical protein